MCEYVRQIKIVRKVGITHTHTHILSIWSDLCGGRRHMGSLQMSLTVTWIGRLLVQASWLVLGQAPCVCVSVCMRVKVLWWRSSSYTASENSENIYFSSFNFIYDDLMEEIPRLFYCTNNTFSQVQKKEKKRIRTRTKKKKRGGCRLFSCSTTSRSPGAAGRIWLFTVYYSSTSREPISSQGPPWSP